MLKLTKHDWGNVSHDITSPTWRDALISVLGPCYVTSVALPLVLPGLGRQDLHVDSRLPKFRTYNLAVQLDPHLQGPQTRLVPRTHGQRWTTGSHTIFIPTAPPYFPWADRVADAPEGTLLLWDAAATHGGPGRLAHQPVRDTALSCSSASTPPLPLRRPLTSSHMLAPVPSASVSGVVPPPPPPLTNHTLVPGLLTT